MRMNLNLVRPIVYLFRSAATNLLKAHKFKIFNTNNLWINLKGRCYIYFRYFRPTSSHDVFCTALKRVMDREGMELEIIINPKVTEDGTSVIQVRVDSVYL